MGDKNKELDIEGIFIYNIWSNDMGYSEFDDEFIEDV